MTVYLYTFGLTEEEKALCERIQALLPSTETSKIIDLQFYQPDPSTEGDSLVIFGPVAGRLTNLLNHRYRLWLPELHQLLPGEKNKEYRQQAFTDLTNLIEQLKLPRIVVTPQEIPKRSSTKEFSFKTKAGHKVIVSDEETKETKADMRLSFDDLHMLSTLVHELGIQEITIVQRDKTTGNDDAGQPSS